MAITKLQPFNLDTTANYTLGNVTATNANLSNLSVSGVVRTDLIPIGNGVQSLGNATNKWSNLYLTGNTIYLGNATISSNATTIVLTNPDGGQTVFAGNTGNSDISGQTLSITGNARLGNIISSGGNITGANVISANLLTGTLTTGSQPNLTSHGTLTSLSVSGTSNLGAVGNVTITGGSSGQVLSTNGSGGLSFISVSSSGVSNGNSNVNIATANGNVTITSAGNTTVTVTGTGANVSGTLSVSGNATIGNIISSGSGGNITGANVISANTFSASGNITANFYIGNGSQLTGLSTAGVSNGNSNVNIATANGNVTIAAVGNTVLTVTGTGANVSGTLSVSGNASFANLTSNGTGGNISGANVISANTVSVSGNATIGNIISSGSGGNITGANVISANLLTGTLTTAAQPNITSTGTLASLSVTGNGAFGNVSATTFTGALSGAATSATTAGTVTTAAQPNITSTGTLASLSVSGTSNLGAVGNVTITGGSSGQVLSTNGSGGLSFISVSSSGVSNGNSNVNIATSGGNVTTSVNGNANILVVTGTGANVAGTLSVSGNASFANLTSNGTGGNITGANVISANTISVSGNATIGNIVSSGSGGNITGANLISANLFTGTLTTAAQPNITSVGTLASLSVTGNGVFGNVNAGNLLTANYSTAVITTGAQPNITSVGTLASLSVSGNVTAGNLIGPHANGNSNVNIATANGNVTVTAVGNTTMTITGTGANVSGTLSVSGNATVGNGIIVTGAIGLGGATYGSSGQVLTSAGSGATPTWATPSAASATYVRTSFTATASQTTFTVAYTVGYAEVFLNGVLLNSTDYTASNGTTIVLGVGATLNDIVEVIAYNVTSLSTSITSTNIAGGTAGVIPYQTGPNVTGFTAAGTAGQVLTSNGTSAPTWATASTGPIKNDITNYDSTVTFSSALTSAANWSSFYGVISVQLTATTELLLIWGSASCHAVVWDNTARTFGTPALVRTATFTSSQDIAAIAISSTSVLVNTLLGGGTALQTVVLSISGTTITVNTAVATTLAIASKFINAQNSGNGANRCVLAGTSYVISYYKTGNYNPCFRAITVSATVPTVGAELTFTAGAAGSNPSTFNTFVYSASVIVHVSASTTLLYAVPISVSGSTLTQGTQATSTTIASQFTSGQFTSGRIFIAYAFTGNLLYGAVVSVSGTTASISTVNTTIVSNAYESLTVQIISNQAFVLNTALTSGNVCNAVTDNAGTAVAGTAPSPYFTSGWIDLGIIGTNGTNVYIAGDYVPQSWSFSGNNLVLNGQYPLTQGGGFSNGSIIPITGSPSSYGATYSVYFANLEYSQTIRGASNKHVYMYNGAKPAFATSFDGTTIAVQNYSAYTPAVFQRSSLGLNAMWQVAKNYPSTTIYFRRAEIS